MLRTAAMFAARFALLALFLGSIGCGSEPVRPQLLLVIDSDLPTSGQITSFGIGKLSRDAAIDTLRVRVEHENDSFVGCAGDDYDRELLVAAPEDWPVSLGIATPDEGSLHRRIRVRAFARRWAGRDACGLGEPPPEVTIDRIVELDLPSEGERIERVVLRGDCRSVASGFSDSTTCVDAGETHAAASAGRELLTELPTSSVLAQWPDAYPSDCEKPAPKGADVLCIAGGFTLLGDAAVAELPSDLHTLPRRPVVVSPFWMDRTEFSVGRLRDLLANDPTVLAASETPALLAVGAFCACTWSVTPSAESDALPLNCIAHSVAAKICAHSGGRLPTEAEWEHAARGRGAGWTYPWGDSSPECGCIRYAHDAAACDPAGGVCGVTEVGPESVDATACGSGTNDASLDGVLNLGGNLTEATSTSAVELDDPCWFANQRGGIAIDPRCLVDDTRVMRGGAWQEGANLTSASGRRFWTGANSMNGFRCVYDAR